MDSTNKRDGGEVERFKPTFEGIGNFYEWRGMLLDLFGEYVRYADHERALAESRAECERLRAEIEADARNVQGYIDIIAEADAQTDAAEKLAGRWEKIAAEHGVRTFTGNDHRLFANELRTALNLEPTP